MSDNASIIPLISSDTAGPLGVKHLPRLWLKAFLSAHGRLPAGYKDIRPGFDTIVLEGLGIDPDAAREYIFTQKPRYLEFEAWLRAQPGADLRPETIERVNEQVVKRQKAPASREKMLSAIGLPADCSIADSIMLNNLDDWREIYEQLS